MNVLADWRAFGWFDQAQNLTKSRGCLITRTGVGIYVATLDQGIAASELVTVPNVCLSAGAPAATTTNFKIINTSDTVKGVRYYDATQLADAAWSCAFGALQFA